MEYKIFEILHAKLEDYIGQHQMVVQDGAAKSFDEYKELCGIIRGLKMAQMEIKELGKNLRESEDQD
jgi:hypothetical protein